MASKPVIAVTMGDPSGIGPEIIARAVADPGVAAACRPFIIGDPGAMETGIASAGVGLTVVETDLPLPASEEGVLYVRRVSSLTVAERKPGKPSVAGGD